MNEAGIHPLEMILNTCSAAAPLPWYPRQYVKETGVDAQALAHCLEELWLSGLIERTPGKDDTGPAITLTRAGERVLLDPEAMQRLRSGQPVSADDHGARLRHSMRIQSRPYVTNVLVALNVFVFAYGYHLANGKGAGNRFLQGLPLTMPVVNVLERTGAFAPAFLIDGQWGRLLTCGFVHIGFLHLLMNMACLFFAGRSIEQMWGHLRYLTIYLTALVGGSCLAAARSPSLSAGASGAVCGLLAAEAVFFLLNSRHLPRSLVRQGRMRVILNFVLIVFISMFANVSGWGHFGGAAAGGLAAFLLHLHRFGPPLWRWFALVGFAPLAWYGDHELVMARITNPAWHEAEKAYVRDRFRGQIQEMEEKAAEVYDDIAMPVLETHPSRRDEKKVENASQAVAETRRDLNALAERFLQNPLFYSPDAILLQDTGYTYLTATAELFGEVEHILQLGDKRTEKDADSLQWQAKRVFELGKTWDDLMRE